MSSDYEPKHLVSRFIAGAAMVAVLISITIMPFARSVTLTAVTLSFLPVAVESVRNFGQFDASAVLGVFGYLLILLSSITCLVLVALRRYASRGRVGVLIDVAGLMLITATAPNYSSAGLTGVLPIIQLGAWPSLGFYEVGYFVAWFSLIIGLVATYHIPRSERRLELTKPVALSETITKPVDEKITQSGYVALDNMLYGGLPTGSSILLTAPPCDEKDMIVRRFMETTLSSNRGCIYLATSLDRVRDLLPRYGRRLQVILCHPRADAISERFPEVRKLKNVDNLTEVNLEFDGAVSSTGGSAQPAVLCLEILDDVLLSHHGATRRWLMDVLGRSKMHQITCLATLNPAMHPLEDSHAVIETFDGHIDLYEAEVQVRPKMLRVKKLAGHAFLDNELLVERSKI